MKVSKEFMEQNQKLTLGVIVAVMSLSWGACKPAEQSQSTTSAPKEVRGAPIASKIESTSPSQTNAITPAEVTVNASTKLDAAVSTDSVASNLVSKAVTVAEPPAGEGDPKLLGFDTLTSFVYEMPDETLGNPETIKTNTVSQIPQHVKDWDKKRVALKGFMLPLKVEGGLVTELLLMKDQSMCCYGAVPKITEWVSVKMIAKGVKPVMDQPVTLHGEMKVGEIRENGFLVGIYAMDGEKMVGPLDM